MKRQVSYSVANFAAKFCNELGTDKTSICSPLSAEIVLALLALGCKNQSHDELLKALDMTDDDAIRSSYGFLTSTLKAVKGATLNVANKVYLKKGGELKPGIEKDAKNVFQSSLDQLDFNESEAAAATINNWVAQQTNDKIKDIVSPDMMTDDTRVVLVNAIYFQGLWAEPFYASATRNRPFRVNEKITINIPMMSLSNTYFDYGVSRKLNAKLLRMWYQGGEASMVIVLPKEVEGLRSVLKKLASGHNIMTDIESMTSTELDIIKIPKFKVETTIDLKKLLPNLGIKSIFNEQKADIDILKSNQNLFVSHAIQKALIIVDEQGTEAAACTVPVMRLCCGRLEPLLFIADR
ncbi:serine protease inhibitor 3/4-like, partial [Choristoneura fumiferana]|uniref:serine protease inhibitor 3/4-like n=1 Tax=Choristoneura fumiferana TaxID=7141 RepID=UPI003D15DEB9